MKRATLVFPLRSSSPAAVLLGEKKRGFGAGKWNGFGGKIAPGESIRAAAARELLEESSLRAAPADLIEAGHLVYLFPANAAFDHDVRVFVTSAWDGDPSESEEMRPQWFATDRLPFGSMWSDDPHWLPLVLGGAIIEAEFVFGADNESVARSSVRVLGRWLTSPATESDLR